MDVTAKCIEKLKENTARDRIGFRPPMRFDEFFLGVKSDPERHPKDGKGKGRGKEKNSINKQLRMRYRIAESFGTLVIMNGLQYYKIPLSLNQIAPTKPNFLLCYCDSRF